MLATAYRNDFQRNWYKLQSAGGESLGDILDDPNAFATELGYLKGETSPDDALQVRANNREYYSQGIQGKVEWDLGFGDTEVNLALDRVMSLEDLLDLILDRAFEYAQAAAIPRLLYLRLRRT